MSGTWETWMDRRGDVARALFYMDVRYEGGSHGGAGISEPNLILTDSQSLISSTNTGSNQSVGYTGMLSVLISWHLQDPVDDLERNRNDVIYSYQGNRNPFIDHPEWVGCVFEDDCGIGTRYCTPNVANSTGLPGVINADGSDVAGGNPLTLTASQLPPNKFGYFLTAQVTGFIPGAGGSDGTLCLLGTIGRFVLQVQNSGPGGEFSIPVDTLNMPLSPSVPVLAGQTWHFQCWYRDIMSSSNFTDAISIAFQ